jgi:hypothetical protein
MATISSLLALTSDHAGITSSRGNANAHSYQRALPHMHAAAQMSSRSDVGVVLDYAVVIHRGSCIHNAVPPNDGICLNYSAGHDDGAFPNLGAW